MALRKAEKEEEKRAREKIRQKLEEDKVTTVLFHFSFPEISVVVKSICASLF
jgi:hypothetical protein